MKKITLLLFSIIFLVYFDNYFAAPVLNKITNALGTNVESGGYLIATYSLAAALGAILFSPFSDRFGRKKLLQFGLVGFALFSIACGFAWDFTSMEWFRGFCGLFGGVLVSNTFAYTADYCLECGKEQELTVVMGKVTAGIFGALVLGVPIGIYVTSIGGWRAPFITAGVIALLVLMPLKKLLDIVPDSPKTGYFKSMGQGFRFMSVPQLSLPLAIFFLQMIPTAFNTYAPNWIELQGYSLQVIAIIYVITGIGSTVAAVRSGSLANRMGSKNLLIIVNLVMGVCVIGMVFLPFSLIQVTCFFALYLACLSARMAQMQAFSMRQVKESERGRYSALISFWIQVGATVGVGSAAKALEYYQLSLLTGGIQLIGEATFAVLILTAFACLFVRQRQHQAQSTFSIKKDMVEELS
jgi:predicted MFS family arabinose efflux permease